MESNSDDMSSCDKENQLMHYTRVTFALHLESLL